MVTLANHRFVPLYFDLGKGGPAYDAGARALAVQLDERLGGSSVPTPDVFAATSAGEQLGKVSNYAPEDEVLAMMRKVVATAADLAVETDEEAKWPTAKRAWLRYCIGDVEGARALLSDPKQPEQALMLARIERWETNTEAAREALQGSAGISKGDMSTEVGRIELLAGNLEAALVAFETVPHDHAERNEVDYRRGIVLYHLGHRDTARAVWLALIQRFGEDRWSYRADWALAGSGKDADSKGGISTGDGKKSALGRHGYMGRKNPDLTMESSER